MDKARKVSKVRKAAPAERSAEPPAKRSAEPPQKRRAPRTVSPRDIARLQQVKKVPVPKEIKQAFEAAVDKFHLDEFLQTLWPYPSKRLQATFSKKGCPVKAYPFSGTDHPVHDDMPEMWALIELAAPLLGAESRLVIGHVNYYPADTAAGISPHQDNEPMLDHRYPIIGIQVGGPAILFVWDGAANEVDGRKGAELEITAEDMYMFIAGFQQLASHGIGRSLVRCKCATRYSATFRVVHDK